MALVMLPCELPWWSVVVRKISSIECTSELDKILEVMQKIHDLCKWVVLRTFVGRKFINFTVRNLQHKLGSR